MKVWGRGVMTTYRLFVQHLPLSCWGSFLSMLHWLDEARRVRDSSVCLQASFLCQCWCYFSRLHYPAPLIRTRLLKNGEFPSPCTCHPAHDVSKGMVLCLLTWGPKTWENSFTEKEWPRFMVPEGSGLVGLMHLSRNTMVHVQRCVLWCEVAASHHSKQDTQVGEGLRGPGIIKGTIIQWPNPPAGLSSLNSLNHSK